MKKLVLASVCTLAFAGAAFAQGTVNFATFIPTYISAQTNSSTYSPFFGGGAAQGGAVGATAITSGGFYYELLWTASGATAPTTLGQLFAWNDSTKYAINAIGVAGSLAAGNGTAGTAITGVAPSTTASFMLVGWSANLGTSWATASNNVANWATAQTSVTGNAFFGITHVGQVTPTGVGSPGVNLFGTVASGLINSPNTQLYLLPVVVPEPSTIALAGLGGLAMLALRRRK